MSLPYKVWTEQEDQSRLVVDEGEYRAQITSVTRKRTKAGTYEMLELTLAFTDTKGQHRTLKDWIVFMDELGWKLRHLAKSAGLIDAYDAGTLDGSHLVGRPVIVKVGIKDGDNGKMNTVKDYLTAPSNKVKSDQVKVDDFVNDTDIPF